MSILSKIIMKLYVRMVCAGIVVCMGELSPLEQRAAAAHHDYMSLGNEVSMGRVPLADMRSWVTDMTAVRLPLHQAYDAGWLCLETAMTVGFNPDATGGSDEMYSPEVLAARSIEYWSDIIDRPGNPVLFRARAIVAIAAVGAYGIISATRDKIRFADFHQAQIDSLTLLHKAHERHQNPELLPDLYAHTLMFLLNCSAAQTNTDMTLPLPSRFQAEGVARSSLLFWTAVDNHNLPNTYLMSASAQVGTNNHYAINVPPSMFQNEKYNVTALALQAFDTKKSSIRTQQERLHLRSVIAGIRSLIRSQIEAGVVVSTEIDPEEGLQDAYDWYAELGPSYHMKQDDKESLMQAINPFEMAVAKEEADYEDLVTLGWLWMELDMATGQEGGFARAEDCFEMAAVKAEADTVQDWPAYCTAKIDKAGASFRRRLQDETERENALSMYQQDLQNIAEGMINGLASIPEQSPHYEPLQQIGRRLATMMLFADGEEGYIAFAPSARQRAMYEGDDIGSDLLLVPDVDGEYPIEAAGKVRLDKVQHDRLEVGIASVGTQEIFGQDRMKNVAPLLQMLMEGGTDFLVERTKRRVLEAALRSIDAA